MKSTHSHIPIASTIKTKSFIVFTFITKNVKCVKTNKHALNPSLSHQKTLLINRRRLTMIKECLCVNGSNEAINNGFLMKDKQ